MKGWKKAVRIGIFVLCFLWSGMSVQAQETENAYEELLEQSGAAELQEALPQETQMLLEDAGVSLWEEEGTELDVEAVIRTLWQEMQEQLKNPLLALSQILAAAILCALLKAVDLGKTEGTVNLVSCLFVGLTVAVPISECIMIAAEMIKAVGVFILACTPVLAGLTAASGHTASASAHSFLMLGAGDVISVAASAFMIPILHVFLMLSLVSALSPDIRVGGLCDAFYKILKWTLGFFMTVFSAILGVQSIFTSNMDAVGLRSLKFTVSNFVPVVGSALSDSIAVVGSSLKALRSGVSAFGVLGVLLVVAPILIRCFAWFLICFCGQAAAGLMGVKGVEELLKAIGKCVEMIMLMLICCLVIMAVSSATVWIEGGNQ